MAKMNTQRPTHNNCNFESHCSKIFLGYHEQRYILMINMAHLWIHIVANFRINDNKHTTYNQKRKNVLSNTINFNYTKYWLNERLFYKSKFFSKILIESYPYHVSYANAFFKLLFRLRNLFWYTIEMILQLFGIDA